VRQAAHTGKYRRMLPLSSKNSYNRVLILACDAIRIPRTLSSFRD